MQIHRLLIILCTLLYFLQSAAAQETGLDETLSDSLSPAQLRAMFLPGFLQDFADTDAPLPISPSSSVPSVSCVQTCFDALQLETGDRVYILGRATGFLAAYFARTGINVTVSEADQDLLPEYRAVWEELGLAGITQIGFSELRGSIGTRRFDAILIHAAVQSVPETLTAMLGDSGTLIAPISTPQDTQIIMKLIKNGDNWSMTALEDQFFPSGVMDLSELDQ